MSSWVLPANMEPQIDLDPAAAERDLVHGRSRASIIAVSWLKKRKTS